MRLCGFRIPPVAAWILLALTCFGDLANAQTSVPGIADNDERLPYHVDSIVAIGLLCYALVVAIMLNHSRPRSRVIGIALAAGGCVGVAAGIWALDLTGQFAELRPPRFAIDPSKPIVMRVLAGAFLVAGAALAIAAYWQSRRTDQLLLPRRNESARFGKISRYYHWTIAILFVLLVPMGTFTTMIPYDVEYRQVYYVIHKSLGLTVFLLAGARVAWLMTSPAPKVSPRLKDWERVMARGAHIALYVFLFAFPISGFVLSTSLGKLSHFYFWDLPMFWGPDEASLAVARLIHKIILPFTFYLVFLAHILGAMKHQYVDKQDDSFRRMVT
jgi:cytochrome b561